MKKAISLRTIGASVALLFAAALPASAQTTATAANTAPEVKDGYFAIPGTGFEMRVNLKPRMDVLIDNRYAGSYDNSNPGSGSPYRFATALIPVSTDPTYDNAPQAAVSARSTAISIDAQTLSSSPCDIAVHYDSDFFGHEYGGSDLYFRVNQVYVRVGNLILGKAVLPLEDGDMWLDGLDYCGPDGMIFARQSGARYNFKFDDGFSAAAGLNDPATEADIVRAPDFTANVRWDNEKFGHVQLSGLLGDVIGTNPKVLDETGGAHRQRENAVIWGLNLSIGITLSASDTLQLQGTYGKGMFPYSNDWFVNGQYDYAADGKIKPLAYTAALVGYSHKWNDKFRSTIGYSMVNLDDSYATTSPYSRVTYHKTQYGMVNLIWSPVPRMDAGIEVLYGSNQLQNGAKSSVTRVQFTVGYSLF